MEFYVIHLKYQGVKIWSYYHFVLYVSTYIFKLSLHLDSLSKDI